LAAVVASAEDDKQLAFDQLGRLIGIELKRPFAIPEAVDEPSYRTQAYRRWHLVSEAKFMAPQRRATPQFQILSTLNTEQRGYDSVYAFAEFARTEGGFWARFALRIRQWICRDKNVRKLVDDARRDAKKAGQVVTNITPESIVGGAGLSLGAYLVATYPFLGMLGAPAIAALVLVLYTLGVDAFCEWIRDDDLRNADHEEN
jgi:hypothetical protein